MAPKTTGFRAAIDAAGPRLRRVISFGSILGRMGLKGETHYAIANAWQSAIAEDLARARPRCSVLSLEWSIWNGAGMGHRLGSLERLARYGVDAIALDDGIDAFERLVQGGATGTLMVTSRFGPPSHVSLDATELPTLRFIDKVRVHYPGLELVVETELSTGRDPYLADHRIDGSAVLPAVVGLEAMAQVASALTGVDPARAIEDAVFRQAVVIPDGGALRIQILALAGEDGRVETAIRTEDDGFATDHMRAAFVFGPQSTIRAPKRIDGHAAAIDAKPLYGSLLFQGEAFRRLGGYSRLSARRIAASLRASDDHAWFGTFEAQRLILGDPALRDALLHALQAAVPHLRVVPVSVERIVRGAGGPPVRLEAVEKTATADTFVFDIVAHDAADAVVESWQGVTFRAISEIALDAVIPAVPEIVAPYLERVARATIGECSIEVALVTTRGLDAEARRMSALAALDLLGRVFARGDGKPLVVDEEGVGLSIAHCGNMTLAVKADREIGCDIESVANGPAPDPVRQARTPAWSLTAELAASGPEPWQAAATRVWALNEVAVKQNQPVDGKCKAHRSRRREVVTFESAFGRTTTIHVPGLADGVVVAIGTSPGPAGVASAPASAFETAATAAVGRR